MTFTAAWGWKWMVRLNGPLALLPYSKSSGDLWPPRYAAIRDVPPHRPRL